MPRINVSAELYSEMKRLERKQKLDAQNKGVEALDRLINPDKFSDEPGKPTQITNLVELGEYYAWRERQRQTDKEK